VTSPDIAKVAKRLYGNGTGFVPNVRQNLYSDLAVALAADGRATRDMALAVEPRGLPRSFDEVGPGHLVLAQETLEYGWWEATVLARAGDVFTLKYRDAPEVPTFVRHRSAIALMWPPAE